MTTFKDFRNNVKPNWCPGCGDFSVQAAIQRAAANVGLEPENLAVISGIGCSGRISGYINSYGLHGIHGRSLPIAQGVKMANRDLTVIASGGDGDGFVIAEDYQIYAERFDVFCREHTINGFPIGLNVKFSGDNHVGFSDGSNENLVFCSNRDCLPNWKPDIVVELL